MLNAKQTSRTESLFPTSNRQLAVEKKNSLNVPMQLFCNKSVIVMGKAQLISVCCFFVLFHSSCSMILMIYLFNVHVTLNFFIFNQYV